MNQGFFRETDLAKGTVLELGGGRSPCSLRTNLPAEISPLPSLPPTIFDILFCINQMSPRRDKGRKWARRVFHLGALHKMTLFITVNVYNSCCDHKQKSLYVLLKSYRFNEWDNIPVWEKFTVKEWDLAATPLAFVFRVILLVLRNQKEPEVGRNLLRAGDKGG